MTAKVVGEYGMLDGFAGPEATRALESQLRALGKDATLHIHDGCDHAFFNDTRPEVYDADHAREAFQRTVSLFRDSL
jgi:carboxymethylenebutenolidase